MRYDYLCDACGAKWEESHPIVDRDKPLQHQCPSCAKEKTVSRMINSLAITHDGIKSLQQRAGPEFNAILNRIKKSYPTKLPDGTKQTINAL